MRIGNGWKTLICVMLPDARGNVAFEASIVTERLRANGIDGNVRKTFVSPPCVLRLII
jgi:hypothetical protein